MQGFEEYVSTERLTSVITHQSGSCYKSTSSRDELFHEDSDTIPACKHGKSRTHLLTRLLLGLDDTSPNTGILPSLNTLCLLPKSRSGVYPLDAQTLAFCSTTLAAHRRSTCPRRFTPFESSNAFPGESLAESNDSAQAESFCPNMDSPTCSTAQHGHPLLPTLEEVAKADPGQQNLQIDCRASQPLYYQPPIKQEGYCGSYQAGCGPPQDHSQYAVDLPQEHASSYESARATEYHHSPSVRPVSADKVCNQAPSLPPCRVFLHLQSLMAQNEFMVLATGMYWFECVPCTCTKCSRPHQKAQLVAQHLRGWKLLPEAVSNLRDK